MARFLATAALDHELDDLLRSPGPILLVSPYLKLSPLVRERLTVRARQGLPTNLVYGKERRLEPATREFLAALPRLRLYFVPTLHAKCYAAAGRAVVASLNLHEYSQQHNREMGVALDATADAEAFRALAAELAELLALAEPVTLAAPAAAAVPPDAPSASPAPGRLVPTSELAGLRGLRTEEALRRLRGLGYLEEKEGTSTGHWLTAAGKAAGGQYRNFPKGHYIWPEGTAL